MLTLAKPSIRKFRQLKVLRDDSLQSFQTHWFYDYDQTSNTQDGRNVEKEYYSEQEIMDDIQEWFGLSDEESSSLFDTGIAILREEFFELCFGWRETEEETKLASIVIPKIFSVEHELPTITYTIDAMIDLENLRAELADVYDWEDPRTVDEICDGKEVEFPWSDEELDEYKKEHIVWAFNEEYGKKYDVEINCDDIVSYKETSTGCYFNTYEFDVMRKTRECV